MILNILESVLVMVIQENGDSINMIHILQPVLNLNGVAVKTVKPLEKMNLAIPVHHIKKIPLLTIPVKLLDMVVVQMVLLPELEKEESIVTKLIPIQLNQLPQLVTKPL